MRPVGYALVGCGAFGRFCLDAHATNDTVRRVAVSDQDEGLAARAEVESGVPAATLDDLLANPAVEMVHLATPPWTHRELGERVLRAGKHLLCEKPLATTMEDADALLGLARENELRLAANLIMRYTPLVKMVKRGIVSGALGAPIRASLENDAQDENLPPDHWFWDPARSGGILVEHAVHFFDFFDHLFGPGAVVAAAAYRRPDGREDRVHAVSRHRGGVLVTQTHAFTQAKPMDRQRWRLVFSRGEIEMEEWIPTRLKLFGYFTPDEQDRLDGPFQFQEQLRRPPEPRTGTNYDENREGTTYEVWPTELQSKDEIYQDAVRALAADLARAIRDPHHRPVVDETNARNSLRLALDARAMAAQI